MTRTTTLTACAIVLGCLGTAASADSVHLSYQGTGDHGKSVSVQLSGGLYFSDGSASKNLWAGQLVHAVDGEDTVTYCTELIQWAGSGQYDIDDVANAPSSGPMGQDKADAIYRLFNATNGGADIDTDKKAAAFQAAIWEIVYDFDQGQSLQSGKVQISGVKASYFDMYTDFANDLTGDKTPNVIAFTNENFQDQLGLQVVPLPGVAAMAGLGLAGIATRRRRA